MTMYQRAIAWILKHEPHREHNPFMESGEPLAPESVRLYPTVPLVSDLFGMNEEIVVADICAEYRRQIPPRRIITIAGRRGGKTAVVARKRANPSEEI